MVVSDTFKKKKKGKKKKIELWFKIVAVFFHHLTQPSEHADFHSAQVYAKVRTQNSAEANVCNIIFLRGKKLKSEH